MKGIGLVTLSADPVGEDAFKAIMSGTPVRVFTTRTGHDEENHGAGGFVPATPSAWHDFCTIAPGRASVAHHVSEQPK